MSRAGDLWLLGEHRLLCGDSTKADDVLRVMNGERAVLFATDPPYLVDYDGTNHPSKQGAADKNKDWGRTPAPDGKAYPNLAQHALREAKVLARNLHGA